MPITGIVLPWQTKLQIDITEILTFRKCGEVSFVLEHADWKVESKTGLELSNWRLLKTASLYQKMKHQLKTAGCLKRQAGNGFQQRASKVAPRPSIRLGGPGWKKTFYLGMASLKLSTSNMLSSPVSGQIEF